MLDGDRVTIGKEASNDVSLADDPTVSRLHAVLERFPTGWSVRDLSSSNGTFVNGDRVWAERPLRTGDEIRIGNVRLAYRDDRDAAPATEAAPAPPTLTPRERDVLVALCRPILGGDVFTEAASIRDIAQELVVSEGAVKQHLANLYDKFAVYDEGRRRVRLANEAIRRGAVTLADLKTTSS
jgi:DNA-binding CsgD family transcriptional regulator